MELTAPARFALTGPFRHIPVLEAILGRSVDPTELQDSALTGYRACAMWSGDLAGLRSEATGAVACALFTATEEDGQRLSYAWQASGLTLKSCEVSEGGEAVVALAPDDCAGTESFEFGAWRSDAAPRTEQVYLEMMAHWQSYSAAEMADRVTPIRMRAAAWQTASERPCDPQRDVDRDVVVRRHMRPYLNFFAVQEMDLQFRKQDGTLSEVVNRGALMMGEAVIVLPYDPRRDAVWLIEQFRAPLFMGGSRAPWTWEPVAGLIDPGETAETAARREAREEAGLNLRALEPAGQAYSSTGALSDYLHLYVGLADFGTSVAASGLDEEGEDIQSQIVAFDALMEAVDAQRYVDLPLYMLALWLSRHRDRLRDMA